MNENFPPFPFAVPNIIPTFAASIINNISRNAGRRACKVCRHFLCPYITYNHFYGIRVPPCTGLMAVQHFSMNVIDDGTGTDAFLLL